MEDEKLYYIAASQLTEVANHINDDVTKIKQSRINPRSAGTEKQEINIIFYIDENMTYDDTVAVLREKSNLKSASFRYFGKASDRAAIKGVIGIDEGTTSGETKVQKMTRGHKISVSLKYSDL